MTSVSVIMDHGNGTKTFLTDGIENPELKTNVIGSPGNLLSPDKYEFYTFDESGDLVKRLMTWDEIQGLIAGSDGDGILGDAAMPMFYSDTLPDKFGATHITANDFQTSDIQGVHKVVESVQNVLKSELAASQSKVPPISKPTLLSNTPNWSLFLPTLIDNAEDGTDVNNLLGLVANSTARQPITADTTLSSITSTPFEPLKDVQNTTEILSTTPAEMTTLFKEYTKKPEKPSRYKVTSAKPSTSIKNGYPILNKTSSKPTENSTFSSFAPKKPYSTSKYGAYSSNNEFWFTSTAPTSPKKTFTSSKYGGYLSNEEPATVSTSTTTPSTRKVSTHKYGSYSISDAPEGYSSTTETAPLLKKTPTTSKYAGYSTNNELLFSSIANVLNQVADDVKSTGLLMNSTTAPADKTISTPQYRVPTDSNRFTPNKIAVGTQYKLSTEMERHPTTDTYRQSSENHQKLEKHPTTDGYRQTPEHHQKPEKHPTTDGYRQTSESHQKPEKHSTTDGYRQTFENYQKPERHSTTDNYRPTFESYQKPERHSTTDGYRQTFESYQKPDRHSTTDGYKQTFENYQKPERHSTTYGYRQTFESYQKPFTETVKLSTSDSAKTTTLLQNKFSAEPTRYTSLAERANSTGQYKPSTEAGKVDKTSSTAQVKYGTESDQSTSAEAHKPFSPFYKPPNGNKYTTFDGYKTGSMVLHKFSTEANKYAGNDGHKTLSTNQYKSSSTEFNRNTITDNSIRKSAATTTVTNDLWATTARVNSASSDQSKYTPVDDKLKKEPTGNTTNYVPLSSSTYYEQKDSNKSTKTYESSTLASTGHVNLQKQPLTMRPQRPTKINVPKITNRPYEHTFPATMTRTQSTITSAEKPLVRISTMRTTIPEQPTTRPEPLVTWTSTFPAVETTSKISLNGVFDSDKLVTEQYVSSNHNRHPGFGEIFGNTTAGVRDSTQASTSSETVTSFYTPSSTKESSKPYATTSFTSIPTSHTKEAPTIRTERPQAVESKTESVNPSSIPHRLHSSPSHTLQEPTETKLHKLTTKPAIQQTSLYDYSSSEMVMQRIPTINPPNKNHTNVGLKFSTKTPYLSTEAMKNITQIAVMLNKMNETSTKNAPVRNEYRNKVTGKPTTDSTKPINALFINDCITSLISSAVKENATTESLNYKNLQNLHSQTSKLPPASEEKENSHIYYYRLPPIASFSDSQRLSSTKLTTDASSVEAQYYKTDVTAPATDAATEKEYQKITIMNHPGDDVVHDGVSAVTNILLETEGRVPNKEMSELDVTNATSPSHETTEPSSELRVSENVTAKNLTSQAPTIKPNQRIENSTYVQALTPQENATESIESISSEEDGKKTNESTTTEALTTDSYEATTLVTTTGNDLKNEYVLDDRNRTQEEEEDKKNYHPYNYTLINHFENDYKSNLTATTVAYGDAVKPRNATVVVTTTKVTTTTTGTTTTTTTSVPSTTTTPAAKASVEKSPIRVTTYKYEFKNITNDEVNRTTTVNPNLKSTTELVEVPLENKTKLENTAELSSTSSPPMGFRSPSNSVQKISSTPSPGVELHPAPHESMGLEASVAYLGDDVKRFVDFCNELSFKIWTTQTGKNLVTTRSIVLSPFSVLSTLAMIFLGARGSSSGIMNDFLRLDDMVTFNPHQVFQNITESVVNTKNIGVANAAFVREIFSDKVHKYSEHL